MCPKCDDRDVPESPPESVAASVLEHRYVTEMFVYVTEIFVYVTEIIVGREIVRFTV